MERFLLVLVAVVAVSASELCPERVQLAPHCADGIGCLLETFVDPTRSNRSVPAEVYYPLNAAAPLPLIVFAHGAGLCAAAYDYIWRGLAPQGFVVALPDTVQTIPPSSIDFGNDMLFLMEHLVQLSENSPASPLFGRVARQALTTGHSLGGGTAFLTADPQFVDGRYPGANLTALSCYSPGRYTIPPALDAAERVTIPVLVVGANEDCINDNEDNAYPLFQRTAAACKVYISLNGGSHCQFLQPDASCEEREAECGSQPTITREQQFALTVDYTVLWSRFVFSAPGTPARAEAWSELTAVLASDYATGVLDAFEQECENP